MRLGASLAMRKQRQVLILCQLLRSCCAASSQAGVSVRLARRADIDAIAAINQRTLPENYTRQFFIQHLMKWPQLNFVAEADASTVRALRAGIMPDNVELGLPVDMELPSLRERLARLSTKVPTSIRRMESDSIDSRDGKSGEEGSREIIGYVLGRMEDSLSTDPSRQGHITSLAVLENYRRLGVAQALMMCLHENMGKHYDADGVSLHVRISNKAATRLYKDVLGYSVSRTVPRYYHDNEDAYVMTRPLQPESGRYAAGSFFGALEQAGGV